MPNHSPAFIFKEVLPLGIVYIINSFVPRDKKKPVSPSLQKELHKIQHMRLKGKSSTYLKDLDDFCLD